MIFWAFTEKSDFLGGVQEKPIQRGGLPKKGGGLGQFADLRGGGLARKRGGGGGG